MRMNARYRNPSGPVYGVVVPYARYRDGVSHFEYPRFYTPNNRIVDTVQPSSLYRSRLRNGVGGGSPQNVILPQRGKFQELKNLILNEKAKELAQLRKNEEIAARAAVLKELTNGQG